MVIVRPDVRYHHAMKRSPMGCVALCFVSLVVQLHAQAGKAYPSQRIADAYTHEYIGGHKIVGEPPSGYEGFLMLWVDDCRLFGIKPDPNPGSTMVVCGRVVFKGPRYPKGGSAADGKYLSYEFGDAHLVYREGQEVRLVFDTLAVDHVRYHFGGVFDEIEGKGSGGEKKHLSGLMTRIVESQGTIDTKLSFSAYNPHE